MQRFGQGLAFGTFGRRKKERVKKKKGFRVCKRKERERRESLVVGLGWGEVQKIRFLGFLCEGSQSVYFFFWFVFEERKQVRCRGVWSSHFLSSFWCAFHEYSIVCCIPMLPLLSLIHFINEEITLVDDLLFLLFQSVYLIVSFV